MKYPILSELNTSREWLDVFKGYNHNLRIGEGEFNEMTNLSSDNFPILSPRKQRGIYLPSSDDSNPQGMVAKDALCYVDGSDFVINEYRVPMKLTEDEKPKTLISMGAYVIIMPDKKYINTTNLNEYGSIEAVVTTSAATRYTLCRESGAEYSNIHTQPTPPEITEEMEKDPSKIPMWVDTSGNTVFKQYSVSDGSWTTVANTYIKIASPGIGLPFSVGDGVIIEGSDLLPSSNELAVIQAMDDVKDDDGNRVGSDWIVIKGIIDTTIEQTTSFSISRRMPDMDFVIESGNRLWGCRYGYQGDTKIVNEIYASKLGDFKNWNCFAGISTDSYAASVGTDGEFTGAITHLGYPIFFKENCLHKVYGNYPANYQIQTTACRGVQKGCERSLAIVNEVLYYKARSGICAYDGSLPEEISSALGEETYHSAVAGSLGNKYYVSMADESENWHFFVFDTMKGMWHREDDTEATCFCNCRGDLYYIDRADKAIKTVKGTGVPETAPIKWEAVTGIIGTDSPDKKYISRMDVRMSLTPGARVLFFAEYDSIGEWVLLFAMDGIKLRSFSVPIRPQRCDHLRLKIIGTGEAKIFSICKTIEWGSDI